MSISTLGLSVGIGNEINQQVAQAQLAPLEINLLSQVGTGNRRRRKVVLETPIPSIPSTTPTIQLTTPTISLTTASTCEANQQQFPQLSIPKSISQSQTLEDILIKPTAEQRRQIINLSKKEEDELPIFSPEQILIVTWSSEDIIKEGVAEINSRESVNDIGTVNDPRMGVSSRSLCSTCNLDNANCPGHFGYIKLNTPIINPMMYRFVARVANCICNSCGGLLVTKSQLKELGILNCTDLDIRLKLIEAASKNKLCSRREAPSPSPSTLTVGEIRACTPNPIYKSNSLKLKRQLIYTLPGDNTKTERVRTIDDLIKIFSSISIEDAEVLGFSNGNHPLKWIMTAIPVIPPCIRTASFREGITGPSLLEELYKDIIRVNSLYATEKPEKRDNVRRDLINLVEALIDNSDSKYGRGKMAFKGIKMVIQGKKGLVRGSAMGKRVNYAGRTVAGPDPSLKFGQIGVPSQWAPILTVKVTVTNFNQLALQKLWDAGKVVRIEFKGSHDQTKLVNENMKKNYQLKVGDRLHRWLTSGDYVLAGRQPTIHKASMMGFEVVLKEQYTLTYPLPISTPFNLDFDGDETTIHVPQDEESMAEVRSLINVKQCITNSESNRPMIGLVMDTLTGSYLLTQKDPNIDLDIWNDCMTLITSPDDLPSLNERLRKHKVRPFSGRALFSAVLPYDFYYSKDDVLITNGVLIQGVLKKTYLGTKAGSIIQELWKRYGRERTATFITDATWVIDRWLTNYGFSIGLTDCFPSDPKFRQIAEEEITRARMLISQMGVKLTDPIEAERQERHIVAELNKARETSMKRAAELLPEGNALSIMVASEAKGAKFNIGQITTMLGQQFFGGERMKPTLSGGTRCLPYFEEDDMLPEARGFCTSSFTSELGPAESFFHQFASRQGLMDTALKTAVTGYTYRRFVKAMEDLVVETDGSVRNPAGQIVQFTYGDDGFDAGELQFVKFEEEDIPFFINLNQVVGQINSKYGY